MLDLLVFGEPMAKVFLSVWRSSTPRSLAKALNIPLRTPAQVIARKITRNLELILNWGTRVGWGNIKTINPVNAVSVASNKLRTLQILYRNQIPTLEFTVDRAKAEEWLKTNSVFGHFDLHGHSALGLDFYQKGKETNVGDAKLFTRYFPKKVESRVHIIKTAQGLQTFYLEKKRVSKERYAEFDITESPTTYVRTYQNGWIFARQVQDDPKAIDLAKQAFLKVGLDFGAVDIMFDGSSRYVVGELNTAPGLEGECFDFYIDNLKSLLL